MVAFLSFFSLFCSRISSVFAQAVKMEHQCIPAAQVNCWFSFLASLSPSYSGEGVGTPEAGIQVMAVGEGSISSTWTPGDTPMAMSLHHHSRFGPSTS